MADMADIDQVEEAWEEIGAVTDVDRVVPITYMNSSAALKAFVGRHGGAVCTSSNARGARVGAGPRRQGPVLPRPAPGPQHRLRHGLRRGRHAGLEPPGRARRARGARRQGRDAAALEGPLLGAPALPPRARRGRGARRVSGRRGDRAPRVRARSWWKSPTGSARPERIQEWVADAPPGSAIAVGTEIHMVQRLAREHPDKTVFSLDPLICPCATMFRIDAPHLAWTLENLVAGDRRESDRRRPRRRRMGPSRPPTNARHHLKTANRRGERHAAPLHAGSSFWPGVATGGGCRRRRGIRRLWRGSLRAAGAPPCGG